jgi:hypothetical protein
MGGEVFDLETVDAAFAEPNIFTPFIWERDHGEYAYVPIKDWEEITQALEEKLEESNETNG